MKQLGKIFKKITKRIEMMFISTFDKHMFGGKRNFDLEEGNEHLREMILSGSPMSVIRMGFSELEIIYEIDDNCHFFKYEKPHKDWLKLLDSDENIEKYHQLIIEAYSNADFITSWYSSRNEGALLKAYGRSAFITGGEVVEPYLFSRPWSEALEGKRVLVVSPFSEVIKEQYKKRDLLFEKNVLPNMYLLTVNSIWYVSSGKDPNFENWFEALYYLKDEISKIDFDIALLGCGTFGTPLVNYIKGLGKQAIYVGGALQIMFGIKGKRWDKKPQISRLYNDAWIYLPPETKPKGVKRLDNGCYWQ